MTIILLLAHCDLAPVPARHIIFFLRPYCSHKNMVGLSSVKNMLVGIIHARCHTPSEVFGRNLSNAGVNLPSKCLLGWVMGDSFCTLCTMYTQECASVVHVHILTMIFIVHSTSIPIPSLLFPFHLLSFWHKSLFTFL